MLKKIQKKRKCKILHQNWKSYILKSTIKKVKRQPTGQEKIFANHIVNEELKYRKQIALKTAKRETIPFKIDISPEKLYKWHMKNY